MSFSAAQRPMGEIVADSKSRLLFDKAAANKSFFDIR